MNPIRKTSEVLQSGNGFYKWGFVTIAALLLGMFAQNLRTPTNIVTEPELTQRVLELQNKIDTQTREIIALRSTVDQQSFDIAAIASKVGVTAHPVIAPTQ
jgi:hypothetical protein